MKENGKFTFIKKKELVYVRLGQTQHHYFHRTTTARAATTAATRQVSPPRVLAPAADGKIQGRIVDRSSGRVRL